MNAQSHRGEGDDAALATVEPRRERPAQPMHVTMPRRSAVAQAVYGARSIAPYANHAVQRLGKAGIIGVALCAFSLATLISTNSPLRQQLSDDAAALEQLASASEGAAVATLASPQTQLASFVNSLPTRQDLPALMGQLVATSASVGVDLEEGRYELMTASKAGDIARYRLSFPVVGSYPQVRSFIDQALVAVPTMSLDGLSLQRGEISDGVVTAELDFAVFVRTEL
jgi:Tfp pilus assembly protein PilO